MNFMTGYTKPVVMACILFPGSSGPLYLITHTHTHTQTHTRTHRHRHTMCVCFRGFTLTSADLSTNKHAHLFRCIVCTQGSIVCTQGSIVCTQVYLMYTSQYQLKAMSTVICSCKGLPIPRLHLLVAIFCRCLLHLLDSKAFRFTRFTKIRPSVATPF